MPLYTRKADLACSQPVLGRQQLGTHTCQACHCCVGVTTLGPPILGPLACLSETGMLGPGECLQKWNKGNPPSRACFPSDIHSANVS